MWVAYYGLNTTNLVMWLVDDAAATRAANKIWRSISFCVCVLWYDIDLTDKSFRARVNPQKTSKEKYDNKTSFRSLLWIKEEKNVKSHHKRMVRWMYGCGCVCHTYFSSHERCWMILFNTKVRKHHITSDLWQKVSTFCSWRSRCYFMFFVKKR